MTFSRPLTGPFVALIAVIAILIAADVGIVAFRLTSHNQVVQAPAGASGRAATGHPCNHGAYVSAAAHAHKGGGSVSSVAKSKLGKNGSCAA